MCKSIFTLLINNKSILSLRLYNKGNKCHNYAYTVLSYLISYYMTYSKKFVTSRLLQRDHATWTVSASKIGVMICNVAPSRL